MLFLTRQESILFVGLCAIMQLVASHQGRGWTTATRELLKYYAPTLLVIVLFLAWRWSYYGDLLPNTYYCKAQGLTITRRSLVYIEGFLASSVPVSLLFVASLFLLASRVVRREGVAGLGFVALLPVLQVVFVAMTTYDWMPFHRYFVPVIAPINLVIVKCLAHALRGHGRLVAVPVLALIMLPFSQGYFNLQAMAVPYPVNKHNQGAWDEVIRSMNAKSSDQDIAAVMTAGYVSYGYRGCVLTTDGLADRHLAHLPGGFHGKADANYVMAKKPKFRVCPT